MKFKANILVRLLDHSVKLSDTIVSSVIFKVLYYCVLYMQYKFFVDGEWRHDERQPFVTGEYGIVNTLYLTGDVDPMPSPLSPHTPRNRTTMDVDNDSVVRIRVNFCCGNKCTT